MQLRWLIFRKIFSLCPIFTSKLLKIRHYASTTHILLFALESFFFLLRTCYLKCPWDGAHWSCFCVAAGSLPLTYKKECSVKHCYLSKRRKKNKKKWTAPWINTQNTNYSVIWNCAVKTILTCLLTVRKLDLMLACTKDSLPLFFSCLKWTF